MIFNRIASY